MLSGPHGNFDFLVRHGESINNKQIMWMRQNTIFTGVPQDIYSKNSFGILLSFCKERVRMSE